MARVWIAVIFGSLAIVDDLVRRRISNWIAVGALVSGLVWQIVENGWRGGFDALLGVLAGGSVFLVFYFLGGMGGGDVKLMAGFGALLGPRGILEAALWTAACGGILALGAIAAASLKRACSRPRALAVGAGLSPAAPPALVSIPYAPAIALGVWLSLVPKH